MATQPQSPAQYTCPSQLTSSQCTISAAVSIPTQTVSTYNPAVFHACTRSAAKKRCPWPYVMAVMDAIQKLVAMLNNTKLEWLSGAMRCLPACSTATLPAGCPHLKRCIWTCNFHRQRLGSIMLLVQTQADLDNKHQLAVAVFQVAIMNVHDASGKVLYSPDGRWRRSFRKVFSIITTAYDANMLDLCKVRASVCRTRKGVLCADALQTCSLAKVCRWPGPLWTPRRTLSTRSTRLLLHEPERCAATTTLCLLPQRGPKTLQDNTTWSRLQPQPPAQVCYVAFWVVATSRDCPNDYCATQSFCSL
jgi:hypothetical protein